jgi:hypothetical protein
MSGRESHLPPEASNQPTAVDYLYLCLLIRDTNWPLQFADPKARQSLREIGYDVEGPEDPKLQPLEPKVRGKLRSWHMVANYALGKVFDSMGYTGAEHLTPLDEGVILDNLENSYKTARELYQQVYPQGAITENPFADEDLFHWLIEIQQAERLRKQAS